MRVIASNLLLVSYFSPPSLHNSNNKPLHPYYSIINMSGRSLLPLLQIIYLSSPPSLHVQSRLTTYDQTNSTTNSRTRAVHPALLLLSQRRIQARRKTTRRKGRRSDKLAFNGRR
jgi:hypothetical protein